MIVNAEALVGVPFRPQGRDPVTGLDCVGLVARVFGINGVRRDYRLRGDHRAELEAGLLRWFRKVRRCQSGDVMLMKVSADQLHLGVRSAAGFLHGMRGSAASLKRRAIRLGRCLASIAGRAGTDMATLVLSTVGTALGGPLGGAIGSLIGHSIDQQLFGPGPRRGPRLGDLAVQTSSYGTAIPRLYGTMRVGGSVVWATDLKESTAQTGAKGQPDTIVYSYSASFAVALSSRRVRAVRRIWADGKLLRGEAGDFKAPATFRFYEGSESQGIDPLIGSIEGIAQTPAYRGLALAVFEDLQLADFGNRIPFLTFEVEADVGPPTIGAIVSDASGGAIDCSASATVVGYAAHGASVDAAVEPLIEHFGVELFDDGETLRSASAGAAVAVADDELGNSASGEAAAKVERTQAAARALPASLSIIYYDPQRDYQAGQMRATAGEAASAHEKGELPAVLEAGAAKALAEASLARRWAKRDRLRLRLPTEYIGLEPGSTLQLPLTPALWTVERCLVEQMVAVVDLSPRWSEVGALPAEPGRATSSPDVVAGETSLALFELPDLDGSAPAGPALHLAAATAGRERVQVALEMETEAGVSSVAAPVPPTVMGLTLTGLGAGQPHLIDLSGSVEVQLVNDSGWLQSCDDAALVAGANAAVIGSEIIQFGLAEPLGDRKFRLSRLMRGRRGTEWAAGPHPPGEPFALLQGGRLRVIPLEPQLSGSTVTVRSVDGAIADSASVSGEALRPPSPVKLAAVVNGAGELDVSWVRRSRNGWAWLDEMDAPLGEMQEGYRVRIAGPGGSFETEVSEPRVTVAAATLAGLGSGGAALTVRQIGDRAVSHPAETTVALP